MGDSSESQRGVTVVAIATEVSLPPSTFTDAALSAPLRILGPVTHSTFSTLLDSHKVLLSAHGLHRDWRGLAESARLDVPSLVACSRISYTSHCLHLWGRGGGTVCHLQEALINMDRHDVLADTKNIIESDWQRVQREGFAALPMTLQQDQEAHAYADDAVLTVHDIASLEQGGGLMHYDALLLHADEDFEFANIMLDKLEKEYGLKVCVKDRDLIAGLQFESVSVVKLITERCSRVVVLLSKAFLQSPLNTYFTNFAGALSIDQRRRIVIPCMLEPCQRPSIISFCHTLDYFRAQGYWDYWKKLRDSIVCSLVRPTVQITELTDSNFNRLMNEEQSTTVSTRQAQWSLQPNTTPAVAAAVASAPPLEAKEASKKKKKQLKPRVRSASTNFLSKYIKKKVDNFGRNGRSASESTCDQTGNAADAALDGLGERRVPSGAPLPILEAATAVLSSNEPLQNPSSSPVPHSNLCNGGEPLNRRTGDKPESLDAHPHTDSVRTDDSVSSSTKTQSDAFIVRETCSSSEATASSLHLLLPDVPTGDELLLSHEACSSKASTPSTSRVAKLFKKKEKRVKVTS